MDLPPRASSHTTSRVLLGFLNFVTLGCGAALLYGGVGRAFSAAVIATVAKLQNCTAPLIIASNASSSAFDLEMLGSPPGAPALIALEKALNCTQQIGALIANGLPPSLQLDDRVLANTLNPFVALVVAGAFMLGLSAAGLCATASPRRRCAMASYNFMLLVALAASGYVVVFCALFSTRLHAFVRLYWIYVAMVAPPNWSAAQVVTWFHAHVWLVVPAAVCSGAMATAALAISARVVGWIVAARRFVVTLNGVLLLFGLGALAAGAVMVRLLIGGWWPPLLLGGSGAAIVASAVAGICGVLGESRFVLSMQIALNCAVSLVVGGGSLACFLAADTGAGAAYARAHWKELDAETPTARLTRAGVEHFVEANFMLLGVAAALTVGALLANVLAASCFLVYIIREERMAEADFASGEGGELLDERRPPALKRKQSGAAATRSTPRVVTPPVRAARRRRGFGYGDRRRRGYRGVAVAAADEENGGGGGGGGSSSSSSSSEGELPEALPVGGSDGGVVERLTRHEERLAQVTAQRRALRERAALVEVEPDDAIEWD